MNRLSLSAENSQVEFQMFKQFQGMEFKKRLCRIG